MVRDIPYSFDFLLENVLDLSHILFAHHGVLGRREDAVPFAMTLKVGAICPFEQAEFWEYMRAG